ncbi:sialidase-4 [Neoarius graeffei]|uniref:sialidase-4 n=1 Tax=Neoarius graeffei TaxID=443677 RepID=UPI00298D395B|nr:sialidase-4 [Neoarius graeffei]
MDSLHGTTGTQYYFPARSVLFQKEASGVTYRIPALIFLQRPSCFLAFCEERLSPADSQANLLVMRKGVFYRNYVEWEDMRVLSTAHLKGHRSMNPCPVYDTFTGTLFLFFIAVLGHTTEMYQLVTGNNVTRLCYVYSQDHGETWSPAIDLTKEVIGDTIKVWATFALGPGHGIQLKSGRLLIPAYAYHTDCRQCFGMLCKAAPHSFCFHSDTHGRTWHFGEMVPEPECVECQLVSVDEEDGTSVLYCNARSTLGSRVQALSFDDGTIFQRGQLVHKLVEPRNGCQGSVIGFPAPFNLFKVSSLGEIQGAMSTTSSPSTAESQFQNFLTPTWVVYGHPTWSTARQDFGLYLNIQPRDPDSWTGPWIIYKGPSAYSDLAYVELGSTDEPPVPVFACLFENGTRTAYDEISFCMFTLFELINNLPKVPPHLSGVKSAEKKKRRRRRRRKKRVCHFCRVC